MPKKKKKKILLCLASGFKIAKQVGAARLVGCMSLKKPIKTTITYMIKILMCLYKLISTLITINEGKYVKYVCKFYGSLLDILKYIMVCLES